MTTVPPWLQVMRDITGTKEVSGSGDNPEILAWRDFIADAYPDMAAYCAGYVHDSIAWCGLTVAYCMAKSGIRPVFGPTATDRWLWALAWKGFGETVTEPQLGDVMIFVWAGGGRHVTLYEGTDDNGKYLCRGGNQSDAVNVAHYSPDFCVGIRRPQIVIAPTIIPPIIPPGPPQPQPAPISFEPLPVVRQWIFDVSGVAGQAAESIAQIDATIAGLQAARARLAGLTHAIPAPGPGGAPPPVILPPPRPPVPDWLKTPPPSPKPAVSRFGDCVALVLKDEGGNDDDPRDPGGRTSRGILQREWDKWREVHPGLPADVWQAPQDQVLEIYRQKYWEVLHCEELPAGVDYAVFDEGVLQGVNRAAKTLQSLVGTDQDGAIGPLTIAAAAKPDPAELINQICDARLVRLQSLSTWPTYGRGWSKRVERLRKAATSMVTKPKPGEKPVDKTVPVPVKSAAESKVNWTALALLATNVISLISKGKITLDPDQIVNMIGIVGPVAIMIFRTFFNFSVAPQSLPSK